MTALLEGRDIACVRGERLIFKHLSFELSRGGALLLVGKNGSGKSSLLRVLAGLLPLAQGELVHQGEAAADDLLGYRASLHYQGHLDPVKPALTAAENLSTMSATLGGDPSRVKEAIDHCGLAHVADFTGRLMSQGQKRRLALARLLTVDRSLWLMDEPTAALDSEGQELVATLVAAHRADGGAVVISTHQELGIPNAMTLNLDAYPGGRMDPLFGLEAV